MCFNELFATDVGKKKKVLSRFFFFFVSGKQKTLRHFEGHKGLPTSFSRKYYMAKTLSVNVNSGFDYFRYFSMIPKDQ